ALYCADAGAEEKRFEADASKVLELYSWPGNVRELKNLVERLVIMTPGATIKKADLPPSISGEVKQGHTFEKYATLKEAKSSFERDFLIEKLLENEGNISKTAEAIGVERSNLHKKIKTYGLDIESLS
ncbi:MAG: sigma-54-dependent Fis family transcriptional regulator, partial [Proteobacteria bacterium]|nr:sigma-54-dependent Fis family transcriptional regulator [Pseudomonadota bacterium]